MTLNELRARLDEIAKEPNAGVRRVALKFCILHPPEAKHACACVTAGIEDGTGHVIIEGHDLCPTCDPAL